MGIKAVFFDLDDTLYSSFDEGDAYAYEQMAAYAQEHFGIDGALFSRSFRESRRRLACRQPGMPAIHDRVLFAQGALEKLGLNAVKYARVIHRVYWDAMLSKMQVRPGVHLLLDELKAKGIKVAVCTDMLADIQLEKLERLGLTDCIDYLVSSEEAGMDKPGAAIFWLAMQKCNVLPQDAVMVGDNFRHDIQGAAAVGIKGVWLNWTGLPSVTKGIVHKEVSTFAEAADYIRTLL